MIIHEKKNPTAAVHKCVVIVLHTETGISINQVKLCFIPYFKSFFFIKHESINQISVNKPQKVN